MESLILDRDLDSSIGPGIEPAIRDNGKRARSAIILLWIMAGIYILSALSAALQFKMWWSSFDAPVHVNIVLANNARQTIMGWVAEVGMIVSAVFFIRWFRRTYRNLHVIDGSYLSYSEGWAAGAWFIPILNWVRPYRIMREICEHTSEHAGRINSKYADSSKLLNLVGGWWALWIIAPIIQRAAGFMALNTIVIKLLLLATGMIFIADVMRAISALLAIRIIKKVSEAEQELYEDAKRTVNSEAAEGHILQNDPHSYSINRE